MDYQPDATAPGSPIYRYTGQIWEVLPGNRQRTILHVASAKRAHMICEAHNRAVRNAAMTR